MCEPVLTSMGFLVEVKPCTHLLAVVHARATGRIHYIVANMCNPCVPYLLNMLQAYKHISLDANGSVCIRSAEEVVCTADEDLVARVMQITGAWPSVHAAVSADIPTQPTCKVG